MEQSLTRKQLNILNAIIDFHDTNRKPPTYQEIADIFDIDHVTAMQHVKSLVRKKWLRVSARDSRSIVILKRPNQETLFLNFKPHIVYRPAITSFPFLTISYNSLFPPIITDSSVINTNNASQILPPTVSNFLAGYEPIIANSCVAECNNFLMNGQSSYYLNGNWKMSIRLPQEGTKYENDKFTALNYGSSQLSFEFNQNVKKVIDVSKQFFNSRSVNSTGMVISDTGHVYYFMEHVVRRQGDLEVFILWSLSKIPVLTADIRLKNNILRNNGTVYFYDKRKEQICHLG